MTNFIVAGEERSGTWPVTQLLNTNPSVMCHSDLVSGPIEQRVQAHRAYYGDVDLHAPFGDGQEMYELKDPVESRFIATNMSLVVYLERTVFPTGAGDETHLGVRLTYPLLDRYQLYESVDEWIRNNRLCLVVVDRNPVECFVSKQQAERGRVWTTSRRRSRCSEYLDADALTAYCNRSLAVRSKLLRLAADATDDYLIVQHGWLDRPADLKEILGDYLGLPPASFGTVMSRRISDDTLEGRISNLGQLMQRASKAVRDLITKAIEEEREWRHELQGLADKAAFAQEVVNPLRGLSAGGLVAPADSGVPPPLGRADVRRDRAKARDQGKQRPRARSRGAS